MTSARKIADRMIMLYDGHVIADDTPEKFLNTADSQVQRFIHGQADEADLQRIRSGFD
jgi:ABC-type transporter Mla maintaining outer membrane lipid asymmetry ATPase subunit MlaF